MKNFIQQMNSLTNEKTKKYMYELNSYLNTSKTNALQFFEIKTHMEKK